MFPRVTVTLLYGRRLLLGMTSLGCPSLVFTTSATTPWLGALLQREGKTPPRGNTGPLPPFPPASGLLVSTPQRPWLGLPAPGTQTRPSPCSVSTEKSSSFFKTSPTSPGSERSPARPTLNTCSVCYAVPETKEVGLWSSGGWRDLQAGQHETLGHGWDRERLEAGSSPAWASGVGAADWILEG